MALTYSYPTLSNPVSKAEIEANFADVAAKFSQIVSADLSSSAGIVSTQLSQPYQEIWVPLLYAGGAGMPVANTILDVAPIPGSNGDTAWTATDVAWVCTDTGAGTGTFDVVYGGYVAGVFTGVTNIALAVSISEGGAGANDARQNYGLSGGSVSLAYTTTVRSIALRVATQDATTVSAAGSFLKVMVCLKRYLTVSP
jgi:hypothetical protein